MKCDKCKSTKECATTRTHHTVYGENYEVGSLTRKSMKLCTSCGATQDLPPIMFDNITAVTGSTAAMSGREKIQFPKEALQKIADAVDEIILNDIIREASMYHSIPLKLKEKK